MGYRLLFHPAYEQDVVGMVRFIAENAGQDAALKAADRADQALAMIADKPHLAAPRNNVLAGLRIGLFRHSGVIPYLVDDTEKEAFILGVFYGGQEWGRYVLARR
ncbi:MAG: type II toxin-antitoxin system RelE/ParE family toxin [Pseudomonadota bacterium]